MQIAPPKFIQSTLKTFCNANWTSRDFLTEDDVRCRLFESLYNSLKRNKNISVHSEIRWYGNNRNSGENKLQYRSDIVIIDYNDLEVNNNNVFKLPSKGYGFNKYFAIIEIKLRRPNNGDSDQKYEEVVKKDVRKLREIKEKTTSTRTTNKGYFVVVFDKKRGRKSLINIDNFQNNIVWDNWIN